LKVISYFWIEKWIVSTEVFGKYTYHGTQQEPHKRLSIFLIFRALYNLSCSPIGERAVQIMNQDIDVLQGRRTEWQLMRIYILSGEYEKAIKKLYRVLNHSSRGYSGVYLKLNPIYDPLRGFPEFQAILDAGVAG